MKIKNVIVLILLIIGLLLVSACTNTSNSGSPPTVATLTQKAETITTVPISTIQTSEPQTTAIIITTIATMITQSPTVATTTAMTDPILHRYIRSRGGSGYEFRFYSNGVLNYRSGTTKLVKDEYFIDTVTNQASGTWTNLGNNKYLVQYLPVGVSGATIVREYTLVPARQDPQYPGITIAEHIESSFEKENLNPGEYVQLNQIYRYYPERGKTD
jgi:hypothetical protein